MEQTFAEMMDDSKRQVKKRSDEFERYMGRKKGCFLSSCICAGLGKPDDCSELMLLREFRDDHLLAFEPGRSLVEEYYSISPGLVKRLQRRAVQDPSLYADLFSHFIQPVIEAIVARDSSLAISRYKAMVGFVERL